MNHSQNGRRRTYLTVLWIARLTSAVLIAFVLLFILGDFIKPARSSPSGSEWVGLALFPFGVCGGLLVGWRWQVLGAILCLGCLASFFVWLVVVMGDRDIPLLLLVFCVPSSLYLIYGFGTKKSGLDVPVPQ